MSLSFGRWGMHEYEPLWRGMQQFTNTRSVIDAGRNLVYRTSARFHTWVKRQAANICSHPGEIPVIQIDRGGQVTYHGPGQLMIYPLIDLKRARLGVRSLVTALEQAVVDLSADFGIEACSRWRCPRRLRP